MLKEQLIGLARVHEFYVAFIYVLIVGIMAEKFFLIEVKHSASSITAFTRMKNLSN